MKLFIVVKWYYELPFSRYEVWKIYKSERTAKRVCTFLNNKNKDKPESDNWGAYMGCEFKVWEREVDDG